MMEINDNKFKQLEKDVREIKDFLIGGEYRENGIKQRVEYLEKKDRKRDKRWWLTIGGMTVILFLIKWGSQIIDMI